MGPDRERALPERATSARGLDVAAVPDRLMASWRRSEEYGVSLESVDPVFAGTGASDTLFFQCGQEVLSGLHETLANEPVSLMLTDAEGLVLQRMSGDSSLLRALDKVHLAPGFAFSEREAGTNGLGLALADRVPSLVRAEQHYRSSLCVYTCAAVPVLDPVTGRLEGAVNITTWSRSRSDLLLALAQSAAGNTAALMLARSTGRTPRPTPKGEVFRVESARLEPGAGTAQALSAAWVEAVTRATVALESGRVVAVVGESGVGRTTLLAQAIRRARPHDRILNARVPAPQDVEAWLSAWGPEIGKDSTAVILSDVDELPAWTETPLLDLVTESIAPDWLDAPMLRRPVPVSVTARSFRTIPESLALLVDTVIEVPPLRDRVEDVLPIARHVALRTRGRAVDFTPAAERALSTCGWPGNTEQLVRVIRQAAARGEVIDIHHLSAEVLTGSRHRLTRIESLEREEIARCVAQPGTTMRAAAAQLGVSRATLYRKMAQYDLHVPR